MTKHIKHAAIHC